MTRRNQQGFDFARYEPKLKASVQEALADPWRPSGVMLRDRTSSIRFGSVQYRRTGGVRSCRTLVVVKCRERGAESWMGERKPIQQVARQSMAGLDLQFGPSHGRTARSFGSLPIVKFPRYQLTNNQGAGTIARRVEATRNANMPRRC